MRNVLREGGEGGIQSINTVRRRRGLSVRNTTLRIVTWNIDGSNDPAQRLSVVAHLWQLRVDIAVLTESHLLDEDIFLDRG